MEWLWPVFREHVEKELARGGTIEPTDEDRWAKFYEVLGVCTVTILVQEPWQNSVRFKALQRLNPDEAIDLYNDPMGWLLDRFGGGKFKLNFHDGWHFVATQNFKPAGEAKWTDLPELGHLDP